MTEYDFSPEAMGRYMSNQDRIEQWVGSSQQHPSADDGQFTIAPSDYGRAYVPNDASYGRMSSRSRSNRNDRHHYAPQSASHGLGVTSSGMEPNQAYESIRQHSSFPMHPHAFSQPVGSRQTSMNGVMPPMNGLNPHVVQPSEIPPLDEHYLDSASRPPSPTHRNMSHRSMPFTGSHRFPARSTSRYSAPPIPMPPSASRYDHRYSRRTPSYTESYRSYSTRSHSTDSYSSRSSRSYGRQPYTTVHPSNNSPTVIQPSRRHPIIVPINGGVGGYVVVPPVGQSLQVVDPARPYRGRSFLSRMLSPSTWGIRRKYRRLAVCRENASLFFHTDGTMRPPIFNSFYFSNCTGGSELDFVSINLLNPAGIFR
ncbi:hypothetical protein GALMADRAFT_1123301 [Galerina marginata CBS 339.88]|uniref:Uncharacterized protein n=1 Tax=Galerina marginata (strain CBS 339.88) TaxID=685588 RepID=A0A067TQB4_GALM3|nr:hypothetical protein GALMADRAFT_1123301 [Galerina marginata CBS 339.88]